ncbi:helix-turn-helix domain-containing protein [Hymenobacter sp. B81]|uniref:helix-turn-helix transcriptional regulator n=1 Tax=Hymenobacter sp. B81 TaxID=3344878 RepID=UPI0037DDD94D
MQPSQAYSVQNFAQHRHSVHVPPAEVGSLASQFHWHGPDEVGSLTFTKYELPGALISDVRGTLRSPLLQQVPRHEPTTALVFQLAGCNESTLEGRRRLQVRGGQHNLLFEPSDDVQHLLLPDREQQFHRLCIAFDPDYFGNLVAGNADWLPLYEQFLPQQNPCVLFDDARPTAAPVLELLAQLRACPYTGTLQRLYLEARLLDLFVAQQQHCLTLWASPRHRRERDLIYAVRAYLDQHYAEPPGLSELARHFGTNDCTLKKGFREQFGTTVFGYVARKRLSEAHQLLVQTTEPVQEVAARVGFGNAAHFATVFKRHFGLSPLQVRRGLGR